MNNYLERLDTFIIVFYKQSTLTKSPHLITAKVESYDDYDADFRAILGRVQAAQAAARGKIAEEQVRQFDGAPEETLANIRLAYGVRR